MDRYAVSHFSHDALRHDLKTQFAHDSRATAVRLSRVAEFEERKLFLDEAQPSMHSYCLDVLHLCEGTASRYIYAARAARRFPVMLDAVADGRLHLTAVVMLSRYLTSGNVDELVEAATHKSKAQIEQLIADRFPRPDLPERLEAIPAPPALQPFLGMAGPPGGRHSLENAAGGPLPAAVPGAPPQHSPENVHAGVILSTPWSVQHSPENVHGGVTPTTPWSAQHSPENVHGGVRPTTPWSAQHSPENAAPGPEARIRPLAPQRFSFQFTGDQETHDLWEYVRSLMSHEVPPGRMAQVFKNVLKLAAAELEKRKFAATARPGPSRPGTSPRHIPAAVKRAVWDRDGGQCTFVSEDGRRCPSRHLLEFDHAEPVARGGGATAENLRLLCRAHNRQAAEREFGADFVAAKLSTARQRAPA